MSLIIHLNNIIQFGKELYKNRTIVLPFVLLVPYLFPMNNKQMKLILLMCQEVVTMDLCMSLTGIRVKVQLKYHFK